MLPRTILKPTPEMRGISALRVPLAAGNIICAIADVLDGVLNYDLISDTVFLVIGSHGEEDVVTVNKWLLGLRPRRDSPEEQERKQHCRSKLADRNCHFREYLTITGVITH